MYEEERQQGIEMQGFGYRLTGPRMAGRGGSLVPGTDWKLLLMSMHRIWGLELPCRCRP